jgi:outer membrane protein assembly factor BamB
LSMLNAQVFVLCIPLLLSMAASTQVRKATGSRPVDHAVVLRDIAASGRLDPPVTHVAVVPIIFNAGAALLPTLMGALANLLTVLFSPKALGQLLRRRWKLAAAVTASLVIVGVVGTPLLRAAPLSRAAARTGGPPSGAIDWAKVAENLIAQEALHRTGEAPPRELVASAKPVPVDSPVNSLAGIQPEASPPRSGEGMAPPAGLRPLWSFQPEDGLFLGTPAIAGKRIYVAANQTDLGGYTGLLASVDFETGKPIWQVTEIGKDALPPFFSSPAVTADGKYVVIGQGLHQDRNASLLCFEAATGKLHWAVKTPLHIESSPAIFGDMAVVGAGAIEGGDGKPVGDPGYVFAVRITDGKQLWKQAVDDPESSPAIDEGGVVYIGSGFNGKAVVALRSASDEELQAQKLDRVIWRTALAYPITAPVTLSGNLVIVGGGNGDMVHSDNNPQGLVVALNRTTGQVVWQVKFEDSVLGRIVVSDGLMLAPLRTGEVAALAVADGHVLWRSRVSGTAPVLAGAAFANERAYVVSSDGYLVAFEASTGKMLEKIYLNDQRKPGSGLSLSSPQVVGSRIVVGSETGGLRALLGVPAGR